MSQPYVSNFMKTVLVAVDAVAALLKLLPTGASAKGASVIGDGTQMQVLPALADGKVYVGDASQPLGVRQAALPGAPAPYTIVPADPTGHYDVQAFSPSRILLSDQMQTITIFDGQAPTELSIKRQLSAPGPVNITMFGSTIDGMPNVDLYPGELLNISHCPDVGGWIEN